MRVVISGAGAVGRHLASDLAKRAVTTVTLIEQDPRASSRSPRSGPRRSIT